MIRQLKTFTINIVAGANAATVVLMLLAGYGDHVNPVRFPMFSNLGMTFPIFLIANLLFLFFWLTFKWRKAWIPLVGYALVYIPITVYMPLNTRQDVPDGTFKILSYNVCQYSGNYKYEDAFDTIYNYLKRQNADIVCLQEVWGNLMERPEFTQMADSMGYHLVKGHGNCILSRFPVLGDTLHIGYPTRNNSSMACWIYCQADSLLLVSNHLESNALSDSDKTADKNMILDPEQERVEQGSKLLLRKLRDAARYRGAQTDTLCALIDRNEEKSILMCGDYNDTPVSYTYQRLAGRLDCAYRKAGRGVGFTYSHGGIYVRIDHVFTSSDWQCLKCYTDEDITASDHLPVVAYLQKKDR